MIAARELRFVAGMAHGPRTFSLWKKTMPSAAVAIAGGFRAPYLWEVNPAIAGISIPRIDQP